jgi:hypothetical protein
MELRGQVVQAPPHDLIIPPPLRPAPATPRVVTNLSPLPAAPVAKRGLPGWVIVLGIVGLMIMGLCMCVMISPIFTSRLMANVIVDNHSGSTICSVSFTRAGSSIPIKHPNHIADGATYRFTTISPGDYDISAYDCDGKTLADDKNISLPTGDFTWTVSPSK